MARSRVVDLPSVLRMHPAMASTPSYSLSSSVYCAMAKPMKYRDVRAALLAQDCAPKQGKGKAERCRLVSCLTRSRSWPVYRTGGCSEDLYRHREALEARLGVAHR